MATATQQKILGAFYTSDPVARFVVHWAVRKADDSVLDPSCGEGVFLQAACERIQNLGNPNPQVWGVDVDPTALRGSCLRSPESKLVEKNFFLLRTGDIAPVTTVVGNPPFIRYQTFNGKQRLDALKRAQEAGVPLPKLCSSWAPFIVHASAFLKQGGRLGMVAPAELIHAQYAREVVRFLLRKFGRVTVRMFQRKLFQDLSEDTVLLLCEDFGNQCGWFSITPGTSIEEAAPEDLHTVPVDIEAIRSGKHRLTRYLLPAKARHLYEGLASESCVVRLGDAADVGIGYVTGCNDYFHLTAREAKLRKIPSRYLIPAVLSLGDFKGTVFRVSDWKQVVALGRKASLLRIPALRPEQLPEAVANYIREGQNTGVANHFKCRIRDAWYSVPHVRVGDAFLSYMSGARPKLVRNASAFVAPNTLHIVKFAQGWGWKPFVAGWHSSLTRMSCEVEGHALGGGMLKLEPSEAERVLVALPTNTDAASLVTKLDGLLRNDDPQHAQRLMDDSVLRRRLGLSISECLILSEAATQLENWRMHK